MRVVIDLQGNQSSGSRNRGIGRYSLAITKAILSKKKEHDVIVVLSSRFLDTIELVRNELKGDIEEENIRVWDAPDGLSYMHRSNDCRRKNAELIRETFIASLQPDIVFVTSLFEGFIDDAVTSIDLMNYGIPTAVVLYDLIPLINASPYLDNPVVKIWYEDKISHLKKADILLSISESSRQEALQYLNMPSAKVVNIGTAADSQFKVVDLSQRERSEIISKYNLNKDFLMYTGGIDHRKNIEGLIRSYAMLDIQTRSSHQLAIVCSINEEQKINLTTLAKSVGLSDDDVIFTGYIPEDDLIALYNLCKAFIFPSWHEGFGLPALEAMNCGAPVIASDRSSLPEVVGSQIAQFNSLDDEEMSEKIMQVLSDDEFREQLLENGKIQCTKFSWEKSAELAIEAFEVFLDKNHNREVNNSNARKRLAYISPLPEQRSGIADYSAELLPSLIEYYDVDVVVIQEEISDDWINENCLVRSVDWFESHSDLYDRVLYHFGNSHFHQHMFDLLYKYPGTVVLHDFYLGHVMESMGLLNDQAYYSHGYIPFVGGGEDIVWNYPLNKKVIDHAHGVIVHSDNSRILANKWFGEQVAKEWSVIPLLRKPAETLIKRECREILNLPEDAFLVCSFGLLGSTKQNEELLDAWLASKLSENPKSYLIFVGENSSNEYGVNIEKKIRQSDHSSRVIITGWADSDTFKNFLSASDIGVQLRTMSRGETSAAVLDCMNYGLPTIVNENGSMADLCDDSVLKIQDEFSLQELVKALEELYFNSEKRSSIGINAREKIADEHSPRKCAKQYFEAIENFYNTNINENHGLLDSIESSDADDNELILLADSISKNHQYPGEKTFFIDVSQLATVDSKSGIQRVVKSILNQLLLNSPEGYRVEPIYSTTDMTGYRYAHGFMSNFLSIQNLHLTEKLIDFKQGDVFLGLDLCQHTVISKSNYFKQLRASGVKTYFVIYDLLPVTKSDCFPKEWLLSEVHSDWLKVVCEGNGALCISNSVQDDLAKWIGKEKIICSDSFSLSCFHLGADIGNSKPSTGLTKDHSFILNKIASKVTFLMIGTIEPRKGYGETLAAFERLWEDGIDINLIIIGKEGWLVDELVSKLKVHSELNERLFWLTGISDEALEIIYEKASCLIFSSEAEGFGLPLIEAAQNNLPIIARDIPVFREVAGENAYYFDNEKSPEVIHDAINRWLEMYEKNLHPKSVDLPWCTWRESTVQLLGCIGIEYT
ncbi:glycosyltransferase [Vibrio sp. 10N.222.52.C12]|uniref:glycosyltransferase n=1 Tax=Vibrio sp. 10N.222.52.C12 TaxID=3229630 RepID=UPI00354F3CE9